jgi:hypothetical protein
MPPHTAFQCLLRISLRCFLMAVIASAAAASPENGHTLRADITFTCLWWSEAQMDGLNPNAPPPKTTETAIAKWEYSDPVGVPHPDTVSVVVKLTAPQGAAAASFEVELVQRWLTGPLNGKANRTWGNAMVLKNQAGMTVAADQSQTIRVAVDIKGEMETLAKRAEWPYALGVRVRARNSSATEYKEIGTAELPIKPGD